MSARDKQQVSSYYYLRDQWVVDGRVCFCRRSGEYVRLKDAQLAAKQLARGIGSDVLVQIIQVRSVVHSEVRR